MPSAIHRLNFSVCSGGQAPSQGMLPASSRSSISSACSLTSSCSQRSNAHSISVLSYSRKRGLMSCSKPATVDLLIRRASCKRPLPGQDTGGAVPAQGDGGFKRGPLATVGLGGGEGLAVGVGVGGGGGVGG